MTSETAAVHRRRSRPDELRLLGRAGVAVLTASGPANGGAAIVSAHPRPGCADA